MLNRNRPDREHTALRDERAVRLLHQARGLRGLTPEQVRRIAGRLDAPPAPARRRWLVPVLATLALLLSAGTALAWMTGTLERLPLVGALLSSHSPVRRAPRAAPALASNDVVAQPEPPPAAKLEGTRAGVAPTAATAHERRGKIAASARVAAVVPAPAGSTAAESPIAREGESFASVLRRWRQDHDGGAALAALDVHDGRFAGGQMTLESRLLRVEILLGEGRDREALAILDGLPLGGATVPRGRELLTVRGELRIKAGRCAEGRVDLAAIAAGSDALGDRARNALAHCR